MTPLPSRLFRIASLATLVFSTSLFGFGHGRNSRPQVCLASVDRDGMVRIRAFGGTAFDRQQVTYVVEGKGGEKIPRTAEVSNRVVTEFILEISAGALEVFQDGQKVTPAQLPGLLGQDTPVLFSGARLTPEELKILRKGTLVIVSPAPLNRMHSYQPTAPVLPVGPPA
jgi:hypothetical protein